MEVTPSNLDIIFRQASQRWQSVLDQTPVWWPKIATEMPSTSRAVDYAWLDRIPQMRKWLGNRVIASVAAKTRRVVNEPYEQTIELPKWDIEDDQLGVFYLAVAMQSEVAKKWTDTLIANHLRSAHLSVTPDGVNNLGFDEQPVFSTVHPILGGVDGKAFSVTGATTQSNLFLNTALNWDNYAAVRAEMRSWVGADGLPLGMGDKLILMVPPALESMGKLIIEADFIPSTTATGGSAPGQAGMTNTYKGSAELFVNPQVADMPNNWWLFESGKVVKPFLFQSRSAPIFTQLTNPQSWNVFNLAKFLYGVEARGAVAETVWFLGAAATSGASYA